MKRESRGRRTPLLMGITLRAVETIDFMTARCAHLYPELLETISGRIINEVADVSRVAHDVSSKSPATLERGYQNVYIISLY